MSQRVKNNSKPVNLDLRGVGGHLKNLSFPRSYGDQDPPGSATSTPQNTLQALLFLSCAYTSMRLRWLLWGQAETEGGMNGLQGSIFLTSSDVAEGEAE